MCPEPAPGPELGRRQDRRRRRCRPPLCPRAAASRAAAAASSAPSGPRTLGVRVEGRSGRRTQLGSRTVRAAANAAAAAALSPQPGVLFREPREASGADSDFDSDLNPLLLLLASRGSVLCVVGVCGGFSPVVHFFFFYCCALFSPPLFFFSSLSLFFLFFKKHP